MTRRQLLALAAGGALAAERKNRAPLSRESLVVKLPAAEQTQLPNGLTLIAIEDNRLPIASIQFRIEGAGSIYAPRPGVAELTAGMLRDGAAGRSGQQIGQEAARLGATFLTSAPSGAETATIEASGLTGHWPEWLALLRDIVLHPTFPADDFTIARQRRLTGLRMRQPGAVVFEKLASMIYGAHPAAIATPSADALAALTPEMLAAWHRERYTPPNTVVTAIGRLRPSALHSQIEKLLGDWKGPDTRPVLPPPPQPASARRIALIDRPGAAQSEIAIGGLLFDRRNPDYFPMLLLDRVLGAGMSSRLFQVLREEKGYAYIASSQFTATRFPGFWQARATVRADATADSIAIMLAQLRRLCDEPVTAEELDDAKRAAAGEFALRLEQPIQILTLCYLRYRYGFSDDYWDRYPSQVNSVSATEMQAAAQKYLNPDRAHLVVVGNAARIRPALAKLGPVE